MRVIVDTSTFIALDVSAKSDCCGGCSGRSYARKQCSMNSWLAGMSIRYQLPSQQQTG